MATPNAVNALQKTKETLNDIKSKLEPVVQRLKDDAFEKATAQAQATVSLSIGMMKYMGARLQGLDQGRNPDDPLRKELNQMRKVLADIKARYPDDKKTEGKSAEGKEDGKSPEPPKPHLRAKLPLTQKTPPDTRTNEKQDKKNREEQSKDGGKLSSGKRKPDSSNRSSKKKRKST